jgi:hypothetical protein
MVLASDSLSTTQNRFGIVRDIAAINPEQKGGGPRVPVSAAGGNTPIRKEKMKLIKSLTTVVAGLVLLAGLNLAMAAQSCCVKAKAGGKDCSHKCCVEAVKNKKTCDKCQASPSCCDKAIAEGKACAHQCCVDATKKKEVCEKCNPKS